jgi:hypothetical protein
MAEPVRTPQSISHTKLFRAVTVSPTLLLPWKKRKISPAPVGIMTMDTYTLWWVSQWVEWRKSRIAGP